MFIVLRTLQFFKLPVQLVLRLFTLCFMLTYSKTKSPAASVCRFSCGFYQLVNLVDKVIAVECFFEKKLTFFYELVEI